MSNGTRIRLKNIAYAWTMALCLAAAGATLSVAQSPTQATQPSNTVALDRVVAVVNNRAILASDVDEELISRALIQQQIRQEDAQASEPSQPEVEARLLEIRKELPACLRQNCASEEGWKLFLTAHELTPERVEAYLRFRLQILRFIELRFRQGIRIAPEEIESYYRGTFLPQFAAGEAKPSLDKVSPRIEEILLERQVNILFDDWLKNLRKQGDVEVLDPTLETHETVGGAGKGGA